MYKTDNEILIFLINFFMLESVGRLLIMGIVHLLRYFGLHQLYYLYYGHANSGHWLFGILLLLAVIISFVRILRKRKATASKEEDEK